MDGLLKIILGLIVIIGNMLLNCYILYLGWSEVVPILFPGLVASGAIAAKISFYIAIWIYILSSTLISQIKVRMNNGI